MTRHVLAYYRPFPWRRIGSARTGRTTVEPALRLFSRQSGLRISQFLIETDSNLRHAFEERTTGQEVMRQLRTGESQGILVCRPEHVFSSAKEALYSLERWIEEGIDFHCAQFSGERGLSMGVGLLAPDGEMLLRGLAELERTTDMERTRQQMRRPLSRGGWKGRVPFGFHLMDGELVEQADRVARIVQMKHAHRRGKTYRQIAQSQEISVATAHRLIRTDLRKLRTLGNQELLDPHLPT